MLNAQDRFRLGTETLFSFAKIDKRSRALPRSGGELQIVNDTLGLKQKYKERNMRSNVYLQQCR